MPDAVQFAERGPHVTVYPHVVFVEPERLYLKDHIIISEFCWIHAGRGTVVGNFIHISSYSSLAGGGACLLEDFVGLSAGVRLISGSELIGGEGLTNPTIPRAYRAVSRSFVHLQKHAFLATNVIVHPGVTIGEGAVIGSNSVVTKDVEPWTINVGAPARSIRKRPSERIRELEARLYEELGVEPLAIAPFLPWKVTERSVPEVSR